MRNNVIHYFKTDIVTHDSISIFHKEVIWPVNILLKILLLLKKKSVLKQNNKYTKFMQSKAFLHGITK